MDKPPRNNTRALMPAHYYEAFGLRVMGLKYEMIGKKIGMNTDSVRHLFSKGGPLHKFWRDWVSEYKAGALEESIDMMWGHLPDVVRTNINDAKMQDSMVAILARKFIFEHTIGKPESRLKINGTLATMSFTEWMQLQSDKENNEGQGAGISDQIQDAADVVSN